VRCQLARICAKYAEEVQAYPWRPDQLSLRATELREGIRLFAQCHWADMPAGVVEILFLGDTAAFCRDDRGEFMVDISQLDPRSVHDTQDAAESWSP
jgi:hypothetical protein